MSVILSTKAAFALKARLHDFSAQQMAQDLLDACADLNCIEGCARVLLERGHTARNAGLLIDEAIRIARATHPLNNIDT